MAQINVTIKNLPQIRMAFAQAPRLMAKNLQKAIGQSIFTIERESKLRTPVRTGFLRSSHTTKLSPLRGEVGPTADYAPFVHGGTRYMRARPFLLQGVQASENNIDGFFRTAVQNTLDKIARDT